MAKNKTGPLIALAALAIGLGALIFVTSSDLGDNLVYYWSPTELAEKGATAKGATVRLGGLVEPGSMEWPTGEPGRFTISDGKNTVKVLASGVPPQMFREGIGVVVEGTLHDDGIFHTQRIMVKHSNEYRAPDEGEMPDLETMYKTTEVGS